VLIRRRGKTVEHLEKLIAEFRAESEDHGLRCWLLELIGDAKSPSALPLLTELVYDEDQSFRYWAVQGLTRLSSKEARQVLWRARANGRID
jgi:HEAT repeat protein